MLKQLDEKNFENEVISNLETTLVDFYADWCGPCQMLSPIIEEIANDKANYNIGKVNVDKNQNLAAKYNVMSIPTLIIFKDGKEHSRMIGVQSKERILAEI